MVPRQDTFTKKAKLNSKLESKNAFMIAYFQNNKHNDQSLDISCFDQRRVVFISLLGLYRTWKQCPSVVLYSCLFLLPIKTDWIYQHSKYRKRRKANQYPQHQMQNLFLNLAESTDFIELLKWKDSQCLLFCALDDYELNTPLSDPLINPFWWYLSKQLINIYDHVTQKPYKPLQLDSKWWSELSQTTEYDVNTESVLCELYFLTMKYKTLQEIIYQSNPGSLCPIISYDLNIYMYHRVCTVEEEEDVYECIAEEERNDWIITDHYDPYDVDNIV